MFIYVPACCYTTVPEGSCFSEPVAVAHVDRAVFNRFESRNPLQRRLDPKSRFCSYGSNVNYDEI